MCCVPSNRRLVASHHRAQRPKLNHLRNLLLSSHHPHESSSSQLQSSLRSTSLPSEATPATASAPPGRRHDQNRYHQRHDDDDETSVSVSGGAAAVRGFIRSEDSRSASLSISSNFKFELNNNETTTVAVLNKPEPTPSTVIETGVSNDKKTEENRKPRSKKVQSAEEKELIAQKERELANKGPCPEAPLGYTASGKKRRKRVRKKLKPGLTAKHNERQFVKHNYHDHAKDDPTHYLLLAAQAAAAEEAKKNGASCGASTVCSVSTNADSAPLKLCGGPGNNGGVSIPFPFKLHDMLDQIESDGFAHVVSWQPHGRAFVIHDKKTFVSDIMPRYFNQTKLTSFQRQLNLYGYLRLCQAGPDKGGYYHELFLRHMPFLCHKMTRVKNKGVGFKAANDPDSEPNFYSMDCVTHHKDYWKPCKAKVAALMADSNSKLKSATTIEVVSYDKTSSSKKDASQKLTTAESHVAKRSGLELNFVSSDGSSSSSSFSGEDKFANDSECDESQGKKNEETEGDDYLLAVWFKNSTKTVAASSVPRSNIFRHAEEPVASFEALSMIPALPNVNSLQTSEPISSPRLPSFPAQDLPPMSPLSYSGSSFDGGHIPPSASLTPTSMYGNVRNNNGLIPAAQKQPVPMTIDCGAPTFSPILGIPSWTKPPQAPSQPEESTGDDFREVNFETEEPFCKLKRVPTFDSFVNEMAGKTASYLRSDINDCLDHNDDAFSYEYDPAMLEPVPLTQSELTDVSSVNSTGSSLLEAAVNAAAAAATDEAARMTLEKRAVPVLSHSFSNDSETIRASSRPCVSVQRLVTSNTNNGATRSSFVAPLRDIKNDCELTTTLIEDNDDDVIMQAILNDANAAFLPSGKPNMAQYVSQAPPLDDESALGEFLDNLIMMED